MNKLFLRICTLRFKNLLNFVLNDPKFLLHMGEKGRILR
jgi:hypothetical protein